MKNFEIGFITNIMEKAKPYYDRFEEINVLFTAPEVIADQKWYLRLIKEHIDLKPIAEKYEEIVLSCSFLEDKSLSLTELVKIQNQCKLLAIGISTDLTFIGSEKTDKCIVNFGSCSSKVIKQQIINMYYGYSNLCKWDAKVQENAIYIDGNNSYITLKNETGIIQIIEENGKKQNLEILVLPPENLSDIEISDKDIKIEISHSGGAGGQNVNKVATAVRAVHIPTQIAVSCQDERSQFANKQKAIKRLYEKVNLYLHSLQMENYRDKRNAIEQEAAKKGIVRRINFKTGVITDIKSGLEFPLTRALVGDMDELIKTSALY